jgi:hypothetical protein
MHFFRYLLYPRISTNATWLRTTQYRAIFGGPDQGCQMVYTFSNQNPNLFNFFGVLEWKKLVFSMSIWNKLRPFGMICGFWYFSGNLVYFPRFGILCQEKSGNPGADCKRRDLCIAAAIRTLICLTLIVPGDAHCRWKAAQTRQRIFAT